MAGAPGKSEIRLWTLQLLVEAILVLSQGHLQEVRRVGPIAWTTAPLLTLQKEFGWEMLPPKGLDAWNILSSHCVHDFNACQGQSFP